MQQLFKCSLLFISLPLISLPTAAQNQVELILDGYAYEVDSNIIYNLTNKTITIEDSGASNCLRPGNLIPLNNAGNLTLLTNNQTIGVVNNRFIVDSQLFYLTSETSNLVCDEGVFIDQIFSQGFEEFISPFLIFANSFD